MPCTGRSISRRCLRLSWPYSACRKPRWELFRRFRRPSRRKGEAGGHPWFMLREMSRSCACSTCRVEYFLPTPPGRLLGQYKRPDSAWSIAFCRCTYVRALSGLEPLLVPFLLSFFFNIYLSITMCWVLLCCSAGEVHDTWRHLVEPRYNSTWYITSVTINGCALFNGTSTYCRRSIRP